jgi:hypothetical protein
MVLGQTRVGEQSNEIVAITALLLMAIEGAMVTIDDVGCQRGMAQKIIDKKGDCLLAQKVPCSESRADFLQSLHGVNSRRRRFRAQPAFVSRCPLIFVVLITALKLGAKKP